MKRILLLMVATAAFARAEVGLTVGEVSDKRTTGEFFKGLEIKLELTGTELADVKGVRVKVDSAVDDTGQNLVDSKKVRVFANDFEKLEKTFHFASDKNKNDSYQVELSLANPARAAKTVKIAGKIELISPVSDPASVVSVEVAKNAGKPLENAALKAAGVELTFSPPKEKEIQYVLEDAGSKLASVEFVTADGKPVKTSGTSSWGGMGSKTVTTSVDGNPDGVIAKIYLLTDKSLLTLPIKLDAVPLP